MSFTEYFSNDWETAEDMDDPALRTHYYACRIDAAEEAVLATIKDEDGFVKNVDDVRHEIYYVSRAYACLMTLTPTRPTETAIDIKVETSYIFPAYRGKKAITRIYQKLGKRLDFKGTSLYRR